MNRLLAVLVGGAGFVGLTWGAPGLGIDPRVAAAGGVLYVLILLAGVLVPGQVPVTSSTVLPGTPEQVFRVAADITLSMQMDFRPNRRLLSQTGLPGEPGSSYVTEDRHMIWKTTVVSSDPPRKLVTTTTVRHALARIYRGDIYRIDIERTYTPVVGGTQMDAKSTLQAPAWAWWLWPIPRRGPEALATTNARIKDYLAAGATATGEIVNERSRSRPVGPTD